MAPFQDNRLLKVSPESWSSQADEGLLLSIDCRFERDEVTFAI